MTLDQPLFGASFSFQMRTLPSNEHEARIEPNEGWAHARACTGPSWLRA